MAQLLPDLDKLSTRRTRRIKRFQSGFTFIELMLATSIFAIVAVAIYSTFSSGLSAWKQTEQAQILYQDIRLALDKIEQDLENAILYSDESEFTNFLGEQNELSFYSLADVYSTRPAHQQLRRITYSLNESKHILQRWEEPFTEFEPEESASETKAEPEEIAAQIVGLNFAYYYQDAEGELPYKWQDSWEATQGLPQAVQIELQLEAKDAPLFTKYVFIPTGNKGEQIEED